MYNLSETLTKYSFEFPISDESVYTILYNLTTCPIKSFPDNNV
jgi:hypothetical protein